MKKFQEKYGTMYCNKCVNPWKLMVTHSTKVKKKNPKAKIDNSEQIWMLILTFWMCKTSKVGY